MGLPIQLTSTLITASSAVIAASQTASATALTLTTASGVTLDQQRRIALTQTGTNSGVGYVITGTNSHGTVITETVLSATASALVSTMDFKTITSITLSVAGTASISVGTNNTGSIPWQAANMWIAPYNLLVAVNLAAGGTIGYGLELTLDRDPCGIRNNNALTAVSAFANGTSMPVTTPATTSGTSLVITPITAWRITTTTGLGALTIQALDAGVGVG